MFPRHVFRVINKEIFRT
ncbi:hypothetical protein [Porphyromonas gingivalis]|uniref:Uncharacterized protein n=1 Tax=Porphyromonas gingivalis TaxID=837 RepID=A0AAF0B9C0_PORGN|nr:hypothetical protein [Porphyromonas gingivalis]WCG00126.1 hypothetical protein NY149_03635 [Porphyromonas gingivalis]WIM92392.1 hypothetical protein QP877_03275 [Porphyromonas gingivalis]